MGNDYSSMASLSHTVVFHVQAEEMSMVDKDGKPKWFCMEETIDHISHGRALEIAKLWDVEGNNAIASTMQDGMVRLTDGGGNHLKGWEAPVSKSKGGKGKL
jgi:acyl-CoA thioesterase